MSLANPRWGAPRIHGELLKLGFNLSEATVAKYMVRPHRPPSQTWRTFLTNHMKAMVSVDFFVVPTVFFRVLFVFVILSHDRRRIAHAAVTEHPTAEWVAHQLLEAFPWDSAPRYLLRDRDGSYGEKFLEAARWLRIQEVLTAAQSPWQNAYVERLVGSVRRECLDHVIVLNETGLRRILRSYFEYYERTRTPIARQRLANRPTDPACCGGTGRRDPTGRRTASSVRTRRRLKGRNGDAPPGTPLAIASSVCVVERSERGRSH
jgi:transposase InsO family protein